MTVSTTTNKVFRNGNGVASSFSYPFKIFETSDLIVIKTDVDSVDTTLVLDSDYSVSGAGDDAGGDVTYPLSGALLATGEKLTIYRDIPEVQETDLRNQGAWNPQVVEDQLDRNVMMIQELNSGFDRTVQFSETEDRSANTNLIPTPESGYVLGWNDEGDLENVPLSISYANAALFVDTLAQLKALDVGTVVDAFMRGAVTPLDGKQNRFYYDATSGSTPDDELVVKPNSVTLPATGRWLAVPAAASGIAANAVTYAKLAADVLQKIPMGLEWQTGLIYSYSNTNYLHSYSAGSIMDSTDTYRLTLISAMEKNSGATWSAGTGNGSYSNAESAIAASTWYKDYLVGKSSNPSDTDIVTATTQAIALADTNVIAAGFDIARPMFGGLISNTTPSGFRLIVWEYGGLYKYTAASASFPNDSYTFGAGETQTTLDIYAPRKHLALVGFVYKNDSGTATAQTVNFTDDQIGYVTPSLTGCFDVHVLSGDYEAVSKIIGTGTPQRVNVKTSSDAVNDIVYANTQGFYHNLIGLI